MENATIFKRRDLLHFSFLPTLDAVLKVRATFKEPTSVLVCVFDFTHPLKHAGMRRSWDLLEANVPQTLTKT